MISRGAATSLNRDSSATGRSKIEKYSTGKLMNPSGIASQKRKVVTAKLFHLSGAKDLTEDPEA